MTAPGEGTLSFHLGIGCLILISSGQKYLGGGRRPGAEPLNPAYSLRRRRAVGLQQSCEYAVHEPARIVAARVAPDAFAI